MTLISGARTGQVCACGAGIVAYMEIETMDKQKLTEKQQVAIRRLELAMLACGRQGVVFIGMDDRLLAFDAATLDELIQGGTQVAQYEAMVEVGQGYPLDVGSVYRDSGGW